MSTAAEKAEERQDAAAVKAAAAEAKADIAEAKSAAVIAGSKEVRAAAAAASDAAKARAKPSALDKLDPQKKYTAVAHWPDRKVIIVKKHRLTAANTVHADAVHIVIDGREYLEHDLPGVTFTEIKEVKEEKS